MTGIKSSRILTPQGTVDGYLYFEQGKITQITGQALPGVDVCDVGDLWVSPGFIDIHTHGGGGHSFGGSVEDVVAACNFHLRHGTTAIYPTIAADRFSKMAQAVENVAAAMLHPEAKSHILGAHMEGPYLSASQAGAQDPDSITPPNEADYLPLLERWGSTVARWTYAPELDPDCAFADALAKYGVVASAGHTDAIYAELRKAMDHGCRLVTHLYSCTSTVTRDHGFRRPGVIETAWLEDELLVEIIADGKHLPPELLRLICKIKGTDSIALVTDSMDLAGCTETKGLLQNVAYIVEDGVCKLPDRSAFAGSIATADRLVRVMVEEAGVSMEDAVKMITRVPAQIMGLTSKGSLAPGMDADILVFDDAVQIRKIICGGKIVQ